MKLILFFLSTMLSIGICFFVAQSVWSRPAYLQDQESLISACKTLKAAISRSNTQTQQSDILVFVNAYRSLRKQISVSNSHRLVSEDEYINKIGSNELNRNITTCVRLDRSPFQVRGWTHNEIDSFMTAVDNGLRIEDIQTTMKLKDSIDLKLLQESLEVRQKP